MSVECLFPITSCRFLHRGREHDLHAVVNLPSATILHVVPVPLGPFRRVSENEHSTEIGR